MKIIKELHKQGKSQKEIAEIVGLTKGTVSYHLGKGVKEKAILRQKKNRIKIKTDLVNLKGGKCIKCGYNKCVAALDFHHRDPKQKEFGLAGLRDFITEKVILELDKCDLLCSNCHRELHYKLNQLN